MKFQKGNPLKGTVTVPGDKSISHRAVMFGALSEGTTRVTNFLQGADCLSTIACFEKLGIPIENDPGEILIHGKGLHGLRAPAGPDLRNPGRAAFFHGTKWRCIHSDPAHEEDYGSPWADGCSDRKSARQWMRPPSDQECSPARHSLPFSCCLRAGQILYSPCRTLRRRTYQCDRTLSVPKSF